MQRQVDVAIVGAGIVGLACALSAARRGHSVAVFERSPKAQGASVRNFGMVWPVGQQPGIVHDRALRTRQIWLDVAQRAGIWCEPVGSLHLAYRDDEAAVLQEFCDAAPGHGYDVQWERADAVVARSGAVRADGLVGAMWSPTELCVDPREAIGSLPGWLTREHGVSFHFDTPVLSVDMPRVQTSRGDWQAERVVVCSGADLVSLYPELYAGCGLRLCKLQMMRTAVQPDGWRLGPHLAGGLTLRHYAAFEMCTSLAALRERVTEETPVFDRWGIHVMASQTGLGEVTIGDSHEYDEAITPFDRDEIDAAILDYLRTFLVAPDLHIAERWHGIYAKNPAGHDLVVDAAPQVKIVNGVGGAGMTTSFGLADEVFDAWG